jgi:FMN-dependent NADH-azoreductase
MNKVLYISANPKSSHSHTLDLANAFVAEYKKSHPADEVVTLDLYKENIQFLDEAMITSMFSGGENKAKAHAELFASCNKYIIAAPMWNLSIPAILKAYIDYISYVGIAFKYTDKGPIGLLSDKDRKVIHVVARGGMYAAGSPAASYECGDSYLRTILGFFGITNVQTLALELTGVLQGEALIKAKDHAVATATAMAKEF